MPQPTTAHATEVTPETSPIYAARKLAWVGSPSCSESCRICAGLYRTFATRGVCDVHSTARAAAVRAHGRAAWDDADDSILVS